MFNINQFRILFYYGVGASLVSLMGVITGLVAYVKYNCNYSTNKRQQFFEKLYDFLASSAEQFSGFSNFFIAAIFTSILSIFSDNLINTSCVIYELCVKKLFLKKSLQIPKILVFVIGLLKICGIYTIGYLTSYFGSTITLLFGLNGAIFGPILGMFLIGMLHPKATGNATFIGGITGLISAGGLLVLSKFYEYQNLVLYHHKTKISEDCQKNYVGTVGTMAPAIVRVSVHYYALIGCIVTVVVTTLLTFLLKVQKRVVDRILISPIAFRFLSEKVIKFELVKYYSVERALYNLDSDSD